MENQVQSFIFETLNCTTIASCQAMSEVYEIVDSFQSETEVAMKSAGLIFVNLTDSEIEFSVNANF